MTRSSGFLENITPLDPQGNVQGSRAYWDWCNRRRTCHPLKLGRAPLPGIPPNHQEKTDDSSCFSPRSDQVFDSPAKSLTHEEGYSISSAQPGWKYAWRGGDGLEIAFVGNAPDAERNPYTPVNFKTFAAGQTMQRTLSPAKRRDQSPSFEQRDGIAPRAPRKMREWAARKNYSQAPCNRFEIIEAAEHIGGWCNDCRPPYIPHVQVPDGVTISSLNMA
jgi:hypothetical protein